MSTSTISFDGHSMNPPPNQAGILPSTSMPPIAHQYSIPNFDGSSTSSFPSEEHTSPDSNPCSVSQNQQLNLCSPHQKDDATERQHCKSKNLFTERRRRDRINAGILRLRALVPKITKVKHFFTTSLMRQSHMISTSLGLFHNALTFSLCLIARWAHQTQSQ